MTVAGNRVHAGGAERPGAGPAGTVGMVVLCTAIALMAGAAGACGVFLRGGSETREVVSVRGERYEMVDEGIYRHNSLRMVAEGVGWDIVTLFGAVPALIGVLPFLVKRSLRGKLFAVGLLGYLFYQYLVYAIGWAFGPLFLLFVVIYAASLAAIVWIVSSIDLPTLPNSFTERFPRRGIAVFCAAIGLLLLVMWLGLVVPALGGETDGLLLGQTTLVVQAMDLGLIVPIAFYTAGLAWRRKPLGYLLAPALLVKAVTMALAICAMLLLAWSAEGSLEVVPLVIFTLMAAAATWLSVKAFRSMRIAPVAAIGED